MTTPRLLSQRGFANTGSGSYTNDPAFGLLIEEALRIGYTVIGYETTRDVEGSDRDIHQAQHIIQQTKAIDPNAKVLVHAGYSHINECCSILANTAPGYLTVRVRLLRVTV
jgi:hypothetical protein